tara:strand:- start:153 stop:593 length:441 start_codon:yes stop_codon:yes gene_type:complete
MSDPISRLLAHYEIDEKSLEVTPKQLKKIKADMKRYKAAITDTTIRDYKRMNMDIRTMNKTVKTARPIKVVDYVPPMPSSKGAIKLGGSDKLRPSDGGHQRKQVTTVSHTTTQYTPTQLKTTHHSRGMAANIVGHYEALLKIVKKK